MRGVERRREEEIGGFGVGWPTGGVPPCRLNGKGGYDVCEINVAFRANSFVLTGETLV